MTTMNHLLAQQSGKSSKEDEDERDSAPSSYSSPSVVRFEVCTGLTDQQRRDLRKLQRSLREQIPNIGIHEALKRNNAIHEHIRFMRESVLDAENLHDIARHAVNKMRDPMQALRYDTDSVIKKLVAKCALKRGGKSFFDWKGFGLEAVNCFNAVPARIRFLKGPLENGKEKMKRRAMRTCGESEAEEERPQDIKGHTERGADRLSAVEKNIQDLHLTLRAKVKRTYESKKRNIGRDYGGPKLIPKRVKKELKRNKDICAIELLFNPKSFTQTVENMYNYSFLVKEGKASLKVRDEKFLDRDKRSHKLNGGPVANYISSANNDKEPPPKPRQAVVSLTLENWKNLVEAYDVSESDVKHRGP